MNNEIKNNTFLISIASFFLGGCGGSGTDPAKCYTNLPGVCAAFGLPISPPSVNPQYGSPDGLYLGTSNTSRSITSLVLENGEIYTAYSIPNQPSTIGGVVQGTVETSVGNIFSKNTIDFNFEGLGVRAVQLSAKYTERASIVGNLTYPLNAQTITFSSLYRSDYEDKPAIEKIAGNYSGISTSFFGRETVAFSILPSGAINGVSNLGCIFSGTVNPLPKGNAYSTTVKFSGSPCGIPDAIVTGKAFLDTANKQLIAISVTNDRSHAFVFSGQSR